MATNAKQRLTRSKSYDVFAPEVKSDRLEKLHELCSSLDYYLVKNPSGEYQLEFDLDKFDKRECYVVLKDIKNVCLYDTKELWYYGFLLANTNLADSVKKIKEGLRLRKK